MTADEFALAWLSGVFVGIGLVGLAEWFAQRRPEGERSRRPVPELRPTRVVISPTAGFPEGTVIKVTAAGVTEEFMLVGDNWQPLP